MIAMRIDIFCQRSWAQLLCRGCVLTWQSWSPNMMGFYIGGVKYQILPRYMGTFLKSHHDKAWWFLWTNKRTLELMMHLTLSKKNTTAGSEVLSHEDVPSIPFCTRGHKVPYKPLTKKASARFYGDSMVQVLNLPLVFLQNIYPCMKKVSSFLSYHPQGLIARSLNHEQYDGWWWCCGLGTHPGHHEMILNRLCLIRQLVTNSPFKRKTFSSSGTLWKRLHLDEKHTLCLFGVPQP